MTFDFRRALTVLAAHEVEFIVVGGISAILALAPYRRAIESTAGRTATAMAWLCRDRSSLGTRFTCTSATVIPCRRK